jgi:hypothetical protein
MNDNDGASSTLGGVGANIALIRARIIDGSRTKDANVGLAFGGVRHRIVGSCPRSV